MFTKTFKQINRKSVKIAGGKGASLGEMTQAKIPVPPGFVVLASAFEMFLKETDLNIEIEAILRKVNHKDISSVEGASEEIQGLILKAKMPKDIAVEIAKEFKKLKSKFVAVRSSATAEDSSTAAWAGQLDTFLNVTKKDATKHVQKCWASLFTPRAIFYRFEKKLHKQFVSVAVVVQAMVQSEISGITFTVHPVTKDRNQMVIEAGFGLGEAIVSGQITPDTYVVHKDDFSILDINVSEQTMAIVKSAKGNVKKKLSAKVGGKQKLTGKQIVELAKLCKQIEKHYKKPQDIEWALYKNKFYITQSRPITTL
jgi:pyruvate, water dikinase